ncbi:MAG: nuclear transport factor 2 family protein [Hyphomonadaceae bacterium]
MALNASAAASLAKWHDMVARKDISALAEIVHPEATFRSPMAFKAYHSAQAVTLILSTVMTVFEDFAYHRTFESQDGRGVVLEFSARVGERSLKGVDVIAFDDDGMIVDFEVMVRPFNALQALGAEMGRRLAAFLPQFKS